MVTKNIVAAIENGKQLGKVISFNRDNKNYWSAVGVQKYNGRYKVYVGEIEENNMAGENCSRDETKEFDTIDGALDYISQTTAIAWEELSSCKGQKIFNPKFCEGLY